MERALISVLIPTYNVELYVEEAIRSVMGQTYRNIEIIIVDDGSTDGTISILNKLAKEDDRILIFKNTHNQKIVNTLNTAFEQARGEFIARMDGDDISLPQRLDMQLAYLEKKPSIALVGLNVIMIDEVGKEIQKENYITGFDRILKAIPYASPIPHFWLARREIYEKVGKYRIPTAEDYDFILRAVDLGYQIDNVPDYLYMQRMRGGNTATASGLIQRKSINYVKLLHKERVAGLDGKDSYTSENLKTHLNANNLEKYLFRISSSLHYKYITSKKKSKILGIIYRVGSIVFAPMEQIKDIYNRWKYKKIKFGT